MASSAYIRWVCRGWCLLLCLVSLTGHAATRMPVKVPAGSSVINGAGAASRAGDNIRIPGTPGVEYLPRTPAGTPGTPIKVLPTIDYSIPTTITQAKNLIKANAVQVAASAALAGILAGVGWVMKDGIVVKKKNEPDPNNSAGNYIWALSTGHVGNSPYEACDKYQASTQGSTYPVRRYTITFSSDTQGQCQFFTDVGNLRYTVGRSGNGCTAPAVYDNALHACAITKLVPITDSDLSAVDGFVNAADPEWIRSLMKESCQGSSSPNACLDSLVSQSSLSGPASVNAGSKTSSSTFTRPDGTTGTTSTTSSTTYNVTYGPTYIDYTKNVVTTTYEDGQKTGESIDTENPDVTQEYPDEEDDKDDDVAASPCAGTKCDGPKYDDLYKPKEDTSRSVNDSYISRVQGVPILAAAGNFFAVNVSGSCPSWQTTVNIDLGFYSGSYSLNFDYFCTSTAMQIYQWASYVLMLLAAWVGFKWGILD